MTIQIKHINGTANRFRIVRDDRPDVMVSGVFHKDITGQGIVNGRLVTETRIGTIVCEPYITGDFPDDIDPCGETVTRFGVMFHDSGVFTVRL